jgi:signal transduction histidine kinase
MTQLNMAPDTDEVAHLRALVSEYETKLTDVAALLARVRHEINNPLAALLGQAQLLLREPDLSEKARRRAATIESQAKRIEDIVADLRSFQPSVQAMNRPEE